MSKEHRRSLVAFALVALACAVVLASGLRSNALQGLLGAPAHTAAAAVVVPGRVLDRSAQPPVAPRQVRTHASAPVRPAAVPASVVPERAEPSVVPTRHLAQGHPRSPGRGHAYGRTHAPGHEHHDHEHDHHGHDHR